MMSIPSDQELEGWTGFWDYGMANGGMGGLSNPWTEGSDMAPFDQDVSH